MRISSTWSLSSSQALKLTIGLILILLSLPTLFIEANIPTDSYRNVFFYADIHTAKQILSTGYLPSEEAFGQHIEQIKWYWGKAFNRQKLPIYPVSIAIMSQITGLEPAFFYSQFPSYIGVFLMYIIFLRHFTSSLPLILFVSAWGSMSPNIRILYFQNFTTLRFAILLLVVYLLYLSIKTESRSFQQRVSIILTLFAVWLFYWYPPTVGTILFLSLVMASILFLGGSHNIRPYVYLGLFTGVLMYEIFRLPLSVYQHYIMVGLLSIMDGGAVTGGEIPPTVIQSKYYSVVPLITLLPLGLLGGTLSLIRMRKVFTSNYNGPEIVLVVWGIAVILRGIIYLGTSEAWLITRPFISSLPIMVIASVIALHYLQKRFPTMLDGTTAILLLLILSSPIVATVYLQTTDDRTEIQTYESNHRSIAEWMDTYNPGVAVSDVKTGAPIMTKGYYKIKHPKNYEIFKKVFYSEDSSNYRKATRILGSDILVLSKSMSRKGLYGTTQHHEPISQSQIEQRTEPNNVIFENGRQTIVKFP